MRLEGREGHHGERMQQDSLESTRMLNDAPRSSVVHYNSIVEDSRDTSIHPLVSSTGTYVSPE